MMRLSRERSLSSRAIDHAASVTSRSTEHTSSPPSSAAKKAGPRHTQSGMSIILLILAFGSASHVRLLSSYQETEIIVKAKGGHNGLLSS